MGLGDCLELGPWELGVGIWDLAAGDHCRTIDV